MNDFASPQAVELKKTLLPLVQIVGHNLKWSSIERKGILGRLYAMYHFFSLPFIFGTIYIPFNEGFKVSNSNVLHQC